MMNRRRTTIALPLTMISLTLHGDGQVIRVKVQAIAITVLVCSGQWSGV
jgi:hypothetical protein